MTTPPLSTLLTSIDLTRDPDARLYQKNEIVDVAFAAADGELHSLEGPNAHRAGDALLSAATGERWVVSRERFLMKYRPLPPVVAGEAGHYRNVPTPVWAKRLPHPFSLARCAGGDVLHGAAGDWLLQYAPGDYGVVQQVRFARIYARVMPPAE
ncbi:MAG: PGDYG domain-containing protein [Janthinobacterium lividum]